MKNGNAYIRRWFRLLLFNVAVFYALDANAQIWGSPVTWTYATGATATVRVGYAAVTTNSVRWYLKVDKIAGGSPGSYSQAANIIVTPGSFYAPGLGAGAPYIDPFYGGTLTGATLTLTGYAAGTYVAKHNVAGSLATVSFNWDGVAMTVTPLDDTREIKVTAAYNGTLTSAYKDPQTGKQAWAVFMNGDYSQFLDFVWLGPSETKEWKFYQPLSGTDTLSASPIDLAATKARYGEFRTSFDQDTGQFYSNGGFVVGSPYAVAGSANTMVGTPTGGVSATDAAMPVNSAPRNTGISTDPITNTTSIGSASNAQTATKLSTDAILAQMAAGDSKIQQLTADGFNRVVSAIQGSGGGGGGTDVTPVVNAVDQLAAERRARDEETDALAEAWVTNSEVVTETATSAIMADAEAKAYVAATNASNVFAAYAPYEVEDPYDGWMDAFAPPTHVMLYGVRFDNPFYGTGKWGPTFLKAITWIREFMIWGLIVTYWHRSYRLITNAIMDAINTPAISGNAAIIVSNGGGFVPAAGSLAGLAVKVTIAIVTATLISSLPALFMAMVETSFSPLTAMWNIFISPLATPLATAVAGAGPDGGVNPFGQAIWYVNKIAPIQMMFAVPIYYIVMEKFVFPARMFITFIAMFAKGL